MGVETHDHFVNRLDDLGKKHAAMTRGYHTKVTKDGLIVVRPKKKRRSLPIKGVFLTVVGFFAFKAFALAAVGPVTYTERLEALQGGTAVEQAGAFVMGIDPVTEAVAGVIGPVLR